MSNQKPNYKPSIAAESETVGALFLLGLLLDPESVSEFHEDCVSNPLRFIFLEFPEVWVNCNYNGAHWYFSAHETDLVDLADVKAYLEQASYWGKVFKG